MSVTARATGETLERVEGIENARAVSEPAEEPAAPAPASAAATPGTATPGTATIAAPETHAGRTHLQPPQHGETRRRPQTVIRGEPSAPLVPDPKAVADFADDLPNPPSRTTESAALTAADRTANQR